MKLLKRGSTPATHPNVRAVTFLEPELVRRGATSREGKFFFGPTDVTGTIVGLGGSDMLMPGDHSKVSLELLKPIGMEPGMRFAVREGSKTVGAGVILSVE